MKPVDENDRQAILKVLSGEDSVSPYALLIAQKLNGFAEVLERCVERHGVMPERIVVAPPTSALGEVLVDLFRKMLADIPGAPDIVVAELAVH